MASMFKQASVFNGNIGSWVPSSVISMQEMFSQASSFNQNINGWDVSSVTNLQAMFAQNSAFNSDISSWNLASGPSMYSMFSGSAFNTDISGLNVSTVTNMILMFYNAPMNKDLSSWCVSNISSEPSGFTTFAISNWGTLQRPPWGYCLTAFNASVGQSTDNCFAPQLTPFYYDASGGNPVVGDQVYSDYRGTPLNQTGTIVYYIAGTNAYGVQYGQIISKGACTP